MSFSLQNSFLLSKRGQAALLLTATALVYATALQCGFIWDDDAYLTNNPLISDPGGLWTIWLAPEKSPQYYPLVFSSFWLEYRLWGLNPVGYHLNNILLHIGTAFLFWRIFTHLKIPGAFVAAFIFALHPVGAESVVWITERKNTLSAFLCAASLLAFVRMPLWTNEAQTKRNHFLYAASLLLFLAALMAKTVTCALPAVIFLTLWWKLDGSSFRLRRNTLCLSLIPYFALGLFWGLRTASLETTHVGAQGAEWEFNVAERLLVAGKALWFYAGKIVWPSNLSFVYPRWDIAKAQPSEYLFGFAALALLLLAFAFRRRIGKGPFVCLACYYGILTPALGFFDLYPQRYSFVADHFQYHAMPVLILGLVALATSMMHYLTQNRSRVEPVLTAAAFMVLLALGSTTAASIPRFADEESLWNATIQENPDAWLAHNNLAHLFLTGVGGEPGDSEEDRVFAAIYHLKECLRIKPDASHAHANLATAYRRLGRVEEAEENYLKSIEYSRSRHEAIRFHHDLAGFYAEQQRIEESLRHFGQASAMLGDEDAGFRRSIFLNKAKLWANQREYLKATKVMEEALQNDPAHAEYSFFLIQMYCALGEIEKAQQQAGRMQPLAPYRKRLSALLGSCRQSP